MIRKFKLPDNGIPIRVGDTSFIYQDVFHPIEWYGGEPYRPRVETLVLDNDGTQIFMRKKDGNRYRIPGGSIDTDSSYEKQAENETNEEALLSVRDVKFTGVVYHQPMDKDYIAKGGDSCIPYVGSITYVYTAYHTGSVDKSTIEKKDLDDDMAEHGEFHTIVSVIPILRVDHIKALIESKRITNPKILSMLYERLNDMMVSQSPATIFESGEFVGAQTETKYIYHGSTYDIDVFHPMSLDLGNADQEPGWSTFCFTDYDLAKRFALMRMIQKYLDGKEGSKYKCNWDLKKRKPYIHESIFDEVIKGIKGQKYYVYTIDADSLELGIGNDERFPEVTFREDNVVPEHKDVLYADEGYIISDIELISEDPDVYEKKQMDDLQELNRGWFSCMINRDYSGDSAVAKLTKAVYDGKLKPGDDVVAYMEEHGISLKDISFLERIHQSVTESFDVSPEFEETIILGDARALYTSERKDELDDCCEDDGTLTYLPQDLPPDAKIVYKGFLYEIGLHGELTFMGKYDIPLIETKDGNPLYFLRLFVAPNYRRLGVGSVLAKYAFVYADKNCPAPLLHMEIHNQTWSIKEVRNWIKEKTNTIIGRTENSVVVKLFPSGVEETVIESCEQNLSNLSWYHAEYARPGFNPKTAGGWDEELYSKTIDHAVKQAFMGAVARDKTLLNEKKLSMHMYTAGEELSPIYLGKVAMYYYGLENNGYIPKFDWEWEEQEDFTDAFLSNLREEVHPALLENIIIPQENLEINLDKWAPGTPLWITGASGDGKTTLAKEYKKKKNAIIIHTDLLLIRLGAENNEAFKNKVQKIAKDKIHSDGESWGMDYVESHPELPYGINDKDGSNEDDLKPYFIDFFNWIMESAKTNPKYNKKYIIVEGCDITVMDPNVLAEQPLIIMGGSVFRTICRRVKRKMQKGKSLIPAIIDQLGKYNIVIRLIHNKDAFRKDITDVRSSLESTVGDIEIIDLTEMDCQDSAVIEASDELSVLEPIFIVCTFTGTAFGKVVTKFQHCKFSHSGLALDSSLKKIYTFNTHSKKTGGAGIETIDEYTNVSTGGDGDVCVMCVFVSPTVKQRVKDTIEKIFSNIDKTRYAFGNLFNIVIGKAKETGDSMKMVCSQFVDNVLKLANIDITGKSSNLVSPNDFANAPKKNSKVFVLFDGKNSAYRQKQIDKKVDWIRKNNPSSDISIVTEGDGPNTIVDIVESVTPVSENVIFNKDNTLYNIDKFESGKSNILLVTGLSGSGKSTIAEKYAKDYKAEWIELDIFEHCYGFSDDSLKEAGEVFYEYLSSHKSIWEQLKSRSIKGKELGVEINKFVHYCISWCKKHKDKKWIIEGVQIYSFFSADEVKGYPLIIMGTSMKNSILQRFKRNAGGGKIEWGEELRNEFSNLIRWYWDEEKTLKSFRGEVKSLQEFEMPEQGDFDEYIGFADLEAARESIPQDILEGWIYAITEAKGDKKDEDGLPSLGKDDKTNDYSADAEDSVKEDEEAQDTDESDGDAENPDDLDGEGTDYTEDANAEEEDTGGDASEDDTQSDEGTDGSEDNTDDTSDDSEETGSEGDDVGDDLDAEGTDYTDDADAEGSSDDSGDSSEEETSDTDSEQKNDTQTGNNGVKNYTLLTDFESLYRLASEISDTIEPIIMEKPIQNKVLTQVRSNLSEFKTAIMKFITLYFKADDYPFNRYYYEVFVALLSKNLEMLERNKLLSSKESQKRTSKTNQKEVISNG